MTRPEPKSWRPRAFRAAARLGRLGARLFRALAVTAGFTAASVAGAGRAAGLPAQAPAPLGVFGVDMPAAGKVLFSLLATPKAPIRSSTAASRSACSAG